MSERDPLERRKWNYTAVLAFVVIVLTNLAAGIALNTGRVEWGAWAQIMIPFNGIVLTWISTQVNK